MTRHDEPAEGDVAGVDRVARLLIAEWERVEEKRVNVSYVATFADMARALLASDALRDLLATAWDEGHDAATRRNAIGLNRDHERNPYRAAERAQ